MSMSYIHRISNSLKAPPKSPKAPQKSPAVPPKSLYSPSKEPYISIPSIPSI